MNSSDKKYKEIRSELKKDDVLVFVSGNFNILHPGHVRLLQFAKSNGTVLVVGVTPEGTVGTNVEAEMRLEAIRSIGVVDHALIMDGTVTDVIAALQPDVVAKGKEHEHADNPEREVVESYGGRLLFNSGEMRYTDLGVIDRQYASIGGNPISLEEDFLTRHGYTIADVRNLLKSFRHRKVLVIGDLIVDEYVDCQPLGMSQEDATVVVSPISRRRFVGGSGIVAAHCAGQGAEVDYITVASDDRLWRFAEEKLKNYGVRPHCFFDSSRPTTLKQRYRAHNKTLLRVSDLCQHSIEMRIQDAIVDKVAKLIRRVDAVMFSDFNYGCLPTEMIGRVSEIAKAHDVKLAADSQASSQLSDISRFLDMDLITPTEREARLALKNADWGLVELGEQLRVVARAANIVITLGIEGLIIHAPRYGLIRTDRIHAMNVRPQDVAGAGDCLFSTTTLGLCSGADIWLSSYLGSIAAACQVSKIGNFPLSSEEVIRNLG